MEKISSSQTFFMKRVFPAIWFSFLGIFVATAIKAGDWRASAVFIIQPLVMAVIGYFMFRHLLWGLADEVRDAGTHLVVRKGDVEERIALASVINVDSSRYANPRRITLRLRQPGKLGDEVVFIPRGSFQFNPFARNPVAEALIVRIDALRQKG